MNHKRNVRIKDVAEKAGVSTATVSHVINGTRYVSKEITEKVKKVMKELDYHPNSAARSLRSTKTNTIGFLIPVKRDDTSKSFFMSIAEGIEEKLKDKGYNLILSNSKEDKEQELKQLKLFNTRLVDGLIMAPTNDNYLEIKKTLNNRYPVVMIDRFPSGYNGDYVLVDNFKGTYDGVEELILTNYKRIGFISSELGITTLNERFEAYKKVLDDYNMPFVEELVGFGEASFISGYNLTKKLVEKDVDALFVSNNVMTIGAISYLKDMKIKIPDEVALIGYDNYDWTKITTPSLSVVKQPAFQIGIEAAEAIINRIKYPRSKARQIKLEPKIIKRDSY